MLPPLKTIFIGPFVHCKSLDELDICEQGAIGVDENGVIAFIERDVGGQDADSVATKHGWVNPKVVKIYDTGFFFPGFIGTFKISYDDSQRKMGSFVFPPGSQNHGFLWQDLAR